MATENNDRYLKTLDEISDKVYQFYQLGGRKDLIMVYQMAEKRIYSYVYNEFRKTLSANSKAMLAEQYQEALAENKIVLFIQDDEMRKLKSYVI